MDLLFKILASILLGAVAVSVIYSIISSIITVLALRRKSSSLGKKYYPAVSIMKPLKGIDDDLEENLRSFFELDYPKFELLFGVSEQDDPALEIVRRLQSEYPEIESRLIIDSRRYGLNPKINNLQNIYPWVNYDYILISDSNTRVAKRYLLEIMSLMNDGKIGLVTSTIRGIGARNSGAVLENLHLNTFIAGNVFTVRKLFGIPVTIGKSMLFLRETIEQIGGFRAFRDYLAEDHMIGMRIRALGLGVKLSSQFIDNVNVEWPIKKFLNRHLRWAKMRRNLNMLHYMSEVLANPIVLAIGYALVRFDLSALIVLSGVMFFKFISDTALALAMKADFKWYHYLLIPLKDLLVFGIWLLPFFSRRIVWRGNQFRITERTLLQAVD